MGTTQLEVNNVQHAGFQRRAEPKKPNHLLTTAKGISYFAQTSGSTACYSPSNIGRLMQIAIYSPFNESSTSLLVENVTVDSAASY